MSFDPLSQIIDLGCAMPSENAEEVFCPFCSCSVPSDEFDVATSELPHTEDCPTIQARSFLRQCNLSVKLFRLTYFHRVAMERQHHVKYFYAVSETDAQARYNFHPARSPFAYHDFKITLLREV